MNPLNQTILGLLGASLLGTTAAAQTYAIDWFTIDGGGRTSTGGVYSVSGTIGQHDAGPTLTGGDYSLSGGFWSVVAAIQTPGAPFLAITRELASGLITVSWDATPTGFVLERTGALGSPVVSWTQVPFPYQTNAGRIFITEASLAGNSFYRLKKTPTP